MWTHHTNTHTHTVCAATAPVLLSDSMKELVLVVVEASVCGKGEVNDSEMVIDLK